VPVLQLAHYLFSILRFRATIVPSSQGGFPMKDEMILHDDYETFAEKFLGIDYEEYVELLGGLTDDEDVVELDYSTVF
jgi:hypothetical protein